MLIKETNAKYTLEVLSYNSLLIIRLLLSFSAL